MCAVRPTRRIIPIAIFVKCVGYQLVHMPFGKLRTACFGYILWIWLDCRGVEVFSDFMGLEISFTKAQWSRPEPAASSTPLYTILLQNPFKHLPSTLSNTSVVLPLPTWLEACLRGFLLFRMRATVYAARTSTNTRCRTQIMKFLSSSFLRTSFIASFIAPDIRNTQNIHMSVWMLLVVSDIWGSHSGIDLDARLTAYEDSTCCDTFC
jgi:hypothetical protein